MSNTTRFIYFIDTTELCCCDIDILTDDCVCRKFGYRGVCAGWDIRPITDTSSWEGVVGLRHGQEQPFYRVRAQEPILFYSNCELCLMMKYLHDRSSR